MAVTKVEGKGKEEVAQTASKGQAVPAERVGTEEKKVVRKRRELADVDFDQVEVRAINDEEVAKFRHRKERTAQQTKADALVRQAYERWIAAGKPSEWDKSRAAFIHLKVLGNHYDTFKILLERGAVFHKVAIRFGLRHDAGEYAELVFLAKDRVAGEKNSGGSDDE